MPDNLRHAQYDSLGAQIDDPNRLIAPLGSDPTFGLVGAGDMAASLTSLSRLNDPIVLGATTLISNDATIGVGGWGIENGGTLSTESSDVRVTGRPVLRVGGGATGGAVNNVIRRKIAALAVTGKFELWIKFPILSTGSINVSFGYSSDIPGTDPPTGSATNRRTFLFQPNQNKNGQWQCLTVLRDGTAAQNPDADPWTVVAAPDAALCNQIQLNFSFDAAIPDAERYVLIDTIGFGSVAIPQFILWWDDTSSVTHETLLLPVLNNYGFKAAFTCDTVLLAANRRKLDRLYTEQHDIVNEGRNHTNYSTYPAQLSIDFPLSVTAMREAGYLRALNCFGAPQNSITKTGAEYLKNLGVRLIRGSERIHTPATSRGADTCITMGASSVDQITSANWITLIDNAIANQESTIFLGHRPVTGVPAAQETNIDVIDVVLAYLATKCAAGLCRVVTPSSFIRKYLAMTAR